MSEVAEVFHVLNFVTLVQEGISQYKGSSISQLDKFSLVTVNIEVIFRTVQLQVSHSVAYVVTNC